MLADLPGYGFARVSKAEAAQWNVLISGYLRERRNLRRVILLIDSRRSLMKSDEQVIAFLDSSAVSYQFVLTKADAVSPTELKSVTDTVLEIAAKHPAALPAVIPSSAKTGAGISAGWGLG